MLILGWFSLGGRPLRYAKEMISGWHNNEYLILFEEQIEANAMTERYGVSERIPDHTLIGIRGWNDFILMSPEGSLMVAPTVPLRKEELERWDFKIDLSKIKSETEIGDKIKWLVTPLVFGGSPTDNENISWISIDQHIELVNWWNSKYDEIKNS